MQKTIDRLLQKWALLFKIAPIMALVLLLKVLAHEYGYEVITLNALYTSIVAGTIFLLGFLISGVLSDYKESEKIPSELAASLESMHDDAYTIYKSKNSKNAKHFIAYNAAFLTSLLGWFHKKERTCALLGKISEMNGFFVELEKEGVQANFIIKMKNDQNNLRKTILRIDTIRDTSFVSSAYAIVEALAIALGIGMILINIEPFYESLFFTILVTFLVTYMFFLIKDLDNPFDYAKKGESGTEVSLKPLRDLESRLKHQIEN